MKRAAGAGQSGCAVTSGHGDQACPPHGSRCRVREDGAMCLPRTDRPPGDARRRDQPVRCLDHHRDRICRAVASSNEHRRQLCRPFTLSVMGCWAASTLVARIGRRCGGAWLAGRRASLPGTATTAGPQLRRGFFGRWCWRVRVYGPDRSSQLPPGRAQGRPRPAATGGLGPGRVPVVPGRRRSARSRPGCAAWPSPVPAG
jgi:hypothetical protein